MSGFGKTAAVLAGAMAAAEEDDCKVVYVCRTKRQIMRVVEELSRIQEKYPIEAGSLLTKYDYCLLFRQTNRRVPPESFGWYCSFNVHNNLCSYFLNVTLSPDEFDRAVAAAKKTAMTHTKLVQDAQAIHVCPYEVAKMAMLEARVAVVSFPYAFDQKTSQLLFDSGDIPKSRTILVVDEAHNLRDFLRGTHSSRLTFEELDGAVREADSLLMEDASRSLSSLREIILRFTESTFSWLLDKEALLEQVRRERGTAWLQNLALELTNCSNAAWGSVMYDRRLPSLLIRVGGFLAALSSMEGAILVKLDRSLGLLKPNPVSSLAEYLQQFKSVVLLSATVSPSDVFTRSLGLEPSKVNTYTVAVAPLVTVRTVIDTGVTTKYKSRTPQMFAKIADKICSIAESSESGVGIFASSYSVLEPLRDSVGKRLVGRNLITERRGLTSQEAAEAFESFMSEKRSVLFAVQGGRFSEGEDFRGEMMDSVVVVGLSLPPPTAMLYAEYACLKKAGEQDSYLMLSRLPALRKAFQSAGRHIRSPGKKGLVFFLDYRFNSNVVRDLMPPWLRADILTGDFDPRAIARIASDFWGPAR